MISQQINIASTFNPEYAKLAGKFTARDTLAGGIQWTFAPVIGLGMQPFWTRLFETFGEDPHLVGKLGASMIEGLQENGKTAACAKHFIGYSAPRDGRDRSPSWIPTRHLYQYFVRPWRDVMKNTEKPLTVMESYSGYDGVPNIAYRKSLNGLLREDLDFDGVLVSDFREIQHLFEWHRTAASWNEATDLVLTEGSVDMAMLPIEIYAWKGTVHDSLAKRGEEIEERIDESVRRILELKLAIGIFDEHYSDDNWGLIDKLGDTESRKAAFETARDSIILAKNTNDTVLPIPMEPVDGKKVKVHVTGPTSDALIHMTGGWTIHWQGGWSNDEFWYGETMVDAVKSVNSWDVTVSCGGVDIHDIPCVENTTLVNEEANEADYIIICIGEASHAGKMNLTMSMLWLSIFLLIKHFNSHKWIEKPGDTDSIRLNDGQLSLVRRMKEQSEAKIILVYFGGRPRLLRNATAEADAVVLGFLPGPEGGRAVVDLISGKSNFNGKLPITYPKNDDLCGTPYWHGVSDYQNQDMSLCEVEYPFGHGLSYTKFNYTEMKTDTKFMTYALPWSERTSDGIVNVSVNVKNTGQRAGTDTLMFFIFENSRHVTPEYKRLVHFEKVDLQPGEQKTVSFALTPDTLKYVGPHDDTHDILQMNEKFQIGVGSDTDCRLTKGICSRFVTVRLSDDEVYNPACESACVSLDEYKCLDGHQMSPKECYDKCLSSPSDVSIHINGWGWNYVNCIESILWDHQRSDESKCPAVELICRNVFVSEESEEEGNDGGKDEHEDEYENQNETSIPRNQDPNFYFDITAVAMPVIFGLAIFLCYPLMRLYNALAPKNVIDSKPIQAISVTGEHSPLLKV